MIVILATILSLAYVSAKDRRVGLASSFYIVLVLIFHFIFYFESLSSNVSYFISDELTYLDYEDANGLSDAARADRVLWFEIHRIISALGSVGGLFNKLVSLPLLPFILFLVDRFCNRRKLSVFLFLVFPYLLIMMQTALRDILILFIMLLVVYLWSSRVDKGGGNKLFIVFALGALYFLRPFSVFVLIVSIGVFEFLKGIQGKSLLRKGGQVLRFGVIGGLILLVIYFIFMDQINHYVKMLIYFSDNGLALDDDKTSIEPALTAEYFTYAIIRYVLTPFPTSLLYKLYFEGATQYGYLDDTVRLLNQLFYFFALIAVSFKIIILKHRPVEVWPTGFWLLSIVTVVNSLVYALYYAGGGHSRLKILVYVTVFVALVGTKKVTKNNY